MSIFWGHFLTKWLISFNKLSSERIAGDMPKPEKIIVHRTIFLDVSAQINYVALQHGDVT